MKQPPRRCQSMVAELSGRPWRGTWLPERGRSLLSNFTLSGQPGFQLCPSMEVFRLATFFSFSLQPCGLCGAEGKQSLRRAVLVPQRMLFLGQPPCAVTLDFAEGDRNQWFCKAPLPGVM